MLLRSCCNTQLEQTASRISSGMRRAAPCRDLDYYGRLDTDSRFREPVTVDIFDYMHEKGLHYAWVLRMQEDPRAPLHMPSLASKRCMDAH